MADEKPSFSAIIARKQSQPYGSPIEDSWEPTGWVHIFAKYNFDLGITGAFYLLVVIAAVCAVFYGFSGQTTGFNYSTMLPILFSAAIFGTFVELIRRTFDLAFKRLTTIDLFTSEILSILRVFAAANIVGDFVHLYEKVSQGTPDAVAGIGFADSARKESYFSIFEKNSAELGSLGSATVNNVTAFYTFLRASRDATGALQLWEKSHYDVSQKKEDLVAIIHLCFLTTVHGHEALNQLIASETNKDIATDIVAGVQLQCFAFLDAVLGPDDFRRERLEQRRPACMTLRDKYKYEFGPRG